jgi:hypothetical protein
MLETCGSCLKPIRDEAKKRRYQFKSYCGLDCVEDARTAITNRIIDEYADQQRAQGPGEWRVP